MTTSPHADDIGIELFNVHEDVAMHVAAQRVVNILGRVTHPSSVASLSYSLNGGKERPVYIKSAGDDALRLARIGDFNIDTIDRSELTGDNVLELTAHPTNGPPRRWSWRFPNSPPDAATSTYSLDLGAAQQTQEVGQVVDGKWQIAGDASGQRWLEIADSDEGLDRVILFGRDDLDVGYTIRARLCVTSWFAPLHNVGLLFRWNPHLQGDGYNLPSQWSTGLGYYYSHCPGLRIRIGTDVHVDDKGQKVGDNVLAEAPLSAWRYCAQRLIRRFDNRTVFAQVPAGGTHVFELKIRDDAYALCVWRDGRRKPPPQVVVENPPALLKRGAAGIIAHRCGVRVFDFEIIPD